MKRPLEKYFKSDDEDYTIKTETPICHILQNKLNKINCKIKKTKNKINVKTDELINLIKGNSSKHKQFLKQNEINDVHIHLESLFKEKKTLILTFF